MALPLAGLVLAGMAACRPGPAPSATTAELDAEIVLDLAIAFHDPEGLWASGSFAFDIEESRPDGTLGRSRIELANAERRFELRTEQEGRSLVLRVAGDEVTVLSGGDRLSDATVLEGLGLAPAQVLRLRDRYLYFYGLPMKLRDRGTLLEPVARRTTFRGRAALELRVSYEPEVGSDVWAFFVDPLDYSLLGCRVDHAAGTEDGETVVFDGLADVDGLRLPRIRHRTANRDGRDLGTDTVTEAFR